MSRKRVKQYLMLLTVIGLIAVAASSSGTFATFNAQVANKDNTFAAGTLFLHNTADGTTCASESDSGNANIATGNGCDTLFKNVPLALADTTLDSSSPSVDKTSTQLILSNVELPVIQKNDELTVTNGTTSDTFKATAVSGSGATTTVQVAWVSGDQGTYAAGDTVSRDQITSYADLTLENTGTIDSNEIKFEVPGGCTATLSGGETTLQTTGDLTSGSQSTLSVNSVPVAISNGELITVTDGTHTETLTAGAAASVSASPTTITVTGTLSNGYSHTNTTIKWGSDFGATASSVCGGLRWGIIEASDNSFDPAGAKCAYGVVNGTTCYLDATNNTTKNLGNAPSTMTPLSLTTGGGLNNSGSAGLKGNDGTRYLIIAVQTDNSSGSNTNQGVTASFDMQWEITQS